MFSGYRNNESSINNLITQVADKLEETCNGDVKACLENASGDLQALINSIENLLGHIPSGLGDGDADTVKRFILGALMQRVWVGDGGGGGGDGGGDALNTPTDQHRDGDIPGPSDLSGRQSWIDL